LAERYHINPETGRVNKCTARPGNCRYGSDTAHSATKEEARAIYERQMENETVPQVVTKTPVLKMSKAVAAVYSDVPNEVYPLTDKETAMVRRQLKKGYTNKEIERMGPIGPNTPVYTHFTHNMDATFDYNSPETTNVFTRGACGYLAYALREKTGLPVTMFTHDTSSKYWQGHVAIKLGEDEYLDVTGITNLASIRREYGHGSKPFGVEDFDDTEAYARKIKGPEGDFYADLGELEKAILDRVSRDIVRDFVKN